MVGELTDEHDRTRVDLVRQGDSFTFDAALRPDELADRTGIVVPEDGDYETVGGYVTDVLDWLPDIGDEVAIDAGTLRVERISGSRIDRLRFTPTALDPAEVAEEHAETGRRHTREERLRERRQEHDDQQEQDLRDGSEVDR